MQDLNIWGAYEIHLVVYLASLDFDYIFVMDNTNYDDVISLAKNEHQKSKVQLILNELFPGENVDVPDPYYGLQNGFDMVYEMLDETCGILAKKLIEKHS